MRNSKTLFKAKKLTSLVVLMVTLLTITINLSSCSSKDGGVKYDGKNYGTVDGIVYSGKTPLAGAVVTIKQAGQADRSFITGTTGVFVFNDVQLGAFSLVCSASLFISQTATGTAVSSQTTTIDILMVGDATVKTLIPDPKFEEALIKKGYDIAPVDGSVPTYSINRVTSLGVEGITDLTGIQDFKALEILSCYNSLTTTVKLTKLDVSKNTALKYLNCNYNNLTTLDLSKNVALIELRCDSNLLTILDLSSNVLLTNLSVGDNPLTTTLNLSKNTALKRLNYVYSNNLNVDLSQNKALEYLDCSYSTLTTLDISKNTALKTLNYSDCNSLNAVDISQNTALVSLQCENNKLTTLDVSKNTALRTLRCFTNQLITLDVSKNTALESLNCFANNLMTLDVQNNSALIELICGLNQLTTLDVSKNTALTNLSCGSNKLTTLDASKNTALGGASGGLYCSDNLLTTLNFKNGNNAKITNSNFKNNASGLVIAVDDVAYSKTNWGSYKDASAIYVSSF
jgi:hypothetical protein